jgi:RNA polymerase sigma-32 factor
MNRELATVDNLTSYLTFLGGIPMLTKEEELELATRVVHDNDLEAARELVMSHLRFVVYIAKRYKGYGLPLDDLIQEGNIALMRAVDNYNPITHPNIRLASYAVIYIKGAIRDYVIKNWKIVNVATTKVQRKLFSNLRSMKTKLGASSEEEAQSIAKALNVPVKDVRIMEQRMYLTHTSYDAAGESTTDETYTTSPSEYLHDETNNPETLVEDEEYQAYVKGIVMDFIDGMSDRDRDIILSRKFMKTPITQRELGEKYNISLQRVDQLEKRIIKNLKKMVEEL